MCADFYALPIVYVNQFESQWSAFALVHGVSGAIIDTLTHAMVIWVELGLLVVLGGALLLLNPLIALFAVGYFGLIAIVMNQVLKGWAYSTGKVMAETYWESHLTVQDGIATYREITVADRRRTTSTDSARSGGQAQKPTPTSSSSASCPATGWRSPSSSEQACSSSLCSRSAPWRAPSALSRCSLPPRLASCRPMLR